jgi:16S rRNA (guanine527-N7)-methyltransferase
VSVHPERIAELLVPYIAGLTQLQLEQVSTHIEILLRWNSKMNLTSVRDPEQIVTRHFGESFFLGRQLFTPVSDLAVESCFDIGSGAGFPALPIKILYPSLLLTMVEAQYRKAVFLKEVLRGVKLAINVLNIRAEDLDASSAGLPTTITFRAVEKFEPILKTASTLVRRIPPGRLGLLIGSSQVSIAKSLLPDWDWQPELAVPGSKSRVALIGYSPS